MRLLLGIDGGGTKTSFGLAETNGRILATARLGGVDVNQIGVAGVRAIIEDGSRHVLQQAGASRTDLAAVCAGIPILGESPAWDEQCPRLFAEIFPATRIECVNDGVVALYGALAMQPGIHLVAGTGSIATGRSQAGRIARSGGWSEYFSDEGSCYWLGLQACSLFAKQADSRVPRGPLYDLLRHKLHLAADFDLITYYQQHLLGSREKTAALQILLAEAALAGDTSARQCYLDAAHELALTVIAVFNQLQLPPAPAPATPVSYTGGVFHSGGLILEPLQIELSGWNIRLTEPVLSPTGGALLGAGQLAGLDQPALADMVSLLRAAS